MNYRDLLARLTDVPFKPFRLKMVNNTIVDVHHPGLMLVGRTSAVLPVHTSVEDRGHRVAEEWKTISLHTSLNSPTCATVRRLGESGSASLLMLL